MIHLNTAAVGRLDTRVAQAMLDACLRVSTENFYRDHYPFLQNTADIVRNRVALLLTECGGEAAAPVVPDSIALVASTSDGLATFIDAVNELCLVSKVVAINRGAFPSVLACARMLEGQGSRVLQIGTADGVVVADDVHRLPERTLVIVEHVNYVTGWKNDLAAIATACSQRQSLLLVDAVQSVGASSLDCDLRSVSGLACGGHKWLRGPEGTGFLYVNPALNPFLKPSRRGYRSLVDPKTFGVGLNELEFATSARGLEVGTLNMLGLVGLSESLLSLSETGIVCAQHRICEGAKLVGGALRTFKRVQVITPADTTSRAGIISFRVEGVSSDTLLESLNAAGLICGLRGGLVRISGSFDVNFENVCTRLVQVFRKLGYG